MQYSFRMRPSWARRGPLSGLVAALLGLLAGLLTGSTAFAQTSVFAGNSSGGIVLEVPHSAPAAEHTAPPPSAIQRLRFVSLSRVLRLLQHYRRPEQLPAELRSLAGLQQITHVMGLPQTGEIVLAGPGPGEAHSASSPAFSAQRTAPLDLLLAALHFAANSDTPALRCSIDPRLPPHIVGSARGVSAAARKPPYVACQQISVQGVSRSSPLAHVCVQADIRLKQMALGAYPSGIAELPELVALLPPRSTDATAHVWLSAAFSPPCCSADGTVWAVGPPRVVGHAQRPSLGTGERSAAPRAVQQWAARLTRCDAALAQQHVVFADLQRVMNYCQVAAIVCRPKFDGYYDHRQLETLDSALRTAAEPAPDTLPTIARQRWAGRRQVQVWGGIDIDLARAADAIDPPTPQLAEIRQRARPPAEQEPWWWDAALQPDIDIARETPSSHAGSFYDVAVREEDVIFVIDKSLSMQLPSRSTRASRWQRATEQLMGFVQARGEEPTDLVLFDQQVHCWRASAAARPPHGPVPLEVFLAHIECSGDTDLGAALSWVLHRDAPCQAVYLLSDGALNHGPWRDPGALLRAVRVWNRDRGTRIVTLGIAPSRQGETLLRLLARENRGIYLRVE